jgi:hypothetical protein
MHVGLNQLFGIFLLGLVVGLIIAWAPCFQRRG